MRFSIAKAFKFVKGFWTTEKNQKTKNYQQNV